MLFDKDVLTTGEVAKICNVAPRTVSKWFDSGALEGYRIPGSKDRRIPVSKLIRFMKQHNIPFDSVGGGKIRVLIVDDDAEVRDLLERGLKEQTNYDVRAAANGFEAGTECERFRPHVMLVDAHLSEGDPRQVVNFVRKDDDFQITRVIAMSGKMTDGQLQSLRASGFDGYLKKPFQLRQVVQAIESATSLVN
ncbi:MAG: response regulator [Phycisphaerales bacterium]